MTTRGLLGVLAVVAALAGAVAFALLRGGGQASARVGDFRGARLGMTARDLRGAFEAPSAGGFEVGTTSDRDGAVSVWQADPSAPRAPEAPDAVRFELHGGMLVAIVTDLPAAAPEARGPALETSAAAVRARTPAPDGRVRLEIYARDCPTHRELVDALLARARAPR